MANQNKKKRPSLTAPITGNESDQALKAKADKLQTKATKAARRERKSRAKELSGPPTSATGAAPGGAQAGAENGGAAPEAGAGFSMAPAFNNTPYLPGTETIQQTATDLSEMGRNIGNYVSEGVEEQDNTLGKVGAGATRAIGGVGQELYRQAGKAFNENSPIGDLVAGADEVYQGGKAGMGFEVDGEEDQPTDQPDQAPKGPGQKSVGVEERSFNRGGSYFVNEDGPGGNPIYSGTKEGATDPQFNGGGLSVMGGGRSSRTPSAPPARGVELDQAEQALARGNTGRARSLLQSPEEAQATAEQQETSRLRRQANQQPNLSMPFGQMFQTTAERNAAQEQLQTRAQAEAEKKAARTQAAQSERESQRDFAARMAQVQAENQPEPREWEFEKIQQMTEKGPEESLVAMEPRTGRAISVNPTTPPNSEDLQGLREAAQQGGDAARQAAQAFEKKHGGLPKWYVRFRQQATDGNQTANS